MKNARILALSLLVIVLSSQASLALYSKTGYLSEDLIMSRPIPYKSFLLSANVEYFSASEFQTGTPGVSKAALEPLADANVNSYTSVAIPIKASFSISEDLSARLTFPFVSGFLDNDGAKDKYGAGLGDVRVEGVYEFLKESGNFPSVCGNLQMKLATGRYRNSSSSDLALGSGGTDIYASAIFGKKFGPLSCQALVGIEALGPTEFEINGQKAKFDPPDEIIYSVNASYPFDHAIVIGGEIWGASAGREKWKWVGVSDIKHSEISDLYFSPYLVYEPGPDLQVKIVIDYALSTQPTFAMSNGGANWMKGSNVIIGCSLKT